jgi:hypothetical protein
MMEEDKMESHRKGFLKLKRLSPLKMLLPLYLKRLLELFFFFFFLSLFLAPSLEDLRVSMIFEEKITSSKPSLTYWRWTHIPKLSYAH